MEATGGKNVALQFVFGGSGSGKTRYLYEQAIRLSLEQPDRRFLVVVPEQFTMQAQKEIIRLHPRHGIMNIDVLSFKRLAYRVFDELAVKMPVVLDDMGKSMVLRRVSGRKKSGLGLYGSHLGQAGFINQLKSQISELCQYGITPQDLELLQGETENPLLKQKLGDLGLIFQEFKDYIADHYITAEEILDILCRELPRSEMLKNSVIFLDGYTGFTPVQYRIVELFITHALDVVCAVTVDYGADPYRESGIQNLFYMSKHTVCRLAAMAKAGGVELKEDVILDRRPAWRFAQSPALDFLEQNLYRYNGRAWKGEQDQVKLFCGQTPEEEVRYVKSRIESLVREQGLRYRDMAVATGDLAAYGREITRQFDQAGIPFFMDDKKSILENPMVELIRAVLEAVRDFSYENVFRYLKTGLVYDRAEGTADEAQPVWENAAGADSGGEAIDWEEASDGELADVLLGETGGGADRRYSREEAAVMTDRLENYVRALGINGWKRWDSQWEAQFKGAENLNLQELNAFRQWILAPLRPLREAMSKDATVASVTQALRNYLESMELREKLEEYQAYFAARGLRGDENLAREYGQVYDRVEELFERLTGLLGDEKAERKSYAQILDAGFGEIQVGVIPATIDQVMVGDITRTRLDGVQVLFFVGVNDGVVPQRKNGGSLLGDRDREFFKAHRLELAPTAREDGCMQKFYLYLMLSKPSRRLVITYAGRSADGKSLRPSVLLGEVYKLFPGLTAEDGSTVKWPVQTPRDGKETLIQGLKTYRDLKEPDAADGALEDSQWERKFLELYRWFFGQEDYREEVKLLVQAAFYSYEERGIGRAAARALYGKILQGSVTRLEQYASCAYAHFLRYGLELMERREYELEAVDMGNLFHQSIDRCFQVMKAQGRDWRNLTEEGRQGLVKESVSQVVADYGNTIMMSTARYAYLAGRVERMTDRTIWALAEQVKRGDFEPAGFEVSFSAVDNLKAMRIALSPDEELQLRGRIDRMDLCEDGGTLYVKIIDYKSGGTSFDLAALYYGLQLQLVVYLDAALEMEERKNPGKEVVPAGIFYYNIQDPLVEKKEAMTPEEIEQQILRQLRMNGLVNRELEVIRHLDREIETQSDVIPVALKAGLIQESRSSVASGKRFEQLKSYVNRKLRTAGRDILEGDTSLKPYKQSARTACDYCPYHAVCGFDTKTAGYGYRKLKALKPEEIWEELGTEDRAETDGE
ncbi:putative ATP-dependent nuclease subunit B [[Clostridium] asparagiforme DSM 15981]|uniref:Putative ATP-dependent nuclease subunit B n=2 Tax=Enterocloster asparagiformis TaxID=333367 RepID=C0CXR8_9FIRM|nr:putative ATP-dependent nuclease subunit B [[Clostridium] asparagiforme DSM 15981]